MLARFFRRLTFLLTARRQEEELRLELEHHRTRAQEALEAGGLPAAEAEARSRRVMGNMTLAREDARGVWIAAGLERAWRDALYGLRALRREPVFALTALLTLTLGIATTTTVFTVVDTERWKPLPFPDADQLVAVHAMGPGGVQNSERISAPDYLDWQEQARLTEYAAKAAAGGIRRVLRRTTAESVTVQLVTANFFDVLGLRPRIGRAFAAGESDRVPAAVVSDRGWRRLFDADPGVAGLTATIDGIDYAIVGVLADQHLEFGSDPDFFGVFDRSSSAMRDRLSRTLTVIGRVHDGASMPQAQGELQAITARIADEFPEDHKGHRVQLEGLREYYRINNSRPLMFFLSAAVLVLLLACANVANLLLARALRRQREFAIRGALGGGRGALIHQLFVEGALLAIPSAAIGLLLSFWALRLFVTQVPDGLLGRGGHFAFNGRIAAFVVVISGATAMLLSLAPLFFARRVELNLMLGHGGRTAGRTPAQIRARNGLLVAQLTMTLVLMVAAGLFLSSFAWLTRSPLGFDPDRRVALTLTLSGEKYAADDARRAFADRLLASALATPGVAQAAVDSTSPLGSGPLMRLVAADRPRPAPGDEMRTIIRAVGPDYFSVLGVRQIDGRAFSTADVEGAPPVVIVNEYLASQLFPGERAVGRRLELIPLSRQDWTYRPGTFVIAGVVANARDVSVEEVQFADIYLPFAQAPSTTVELIVRGSIPPGGLVAPLRAAAAALDPSLPVTRVETLNGRVGDSLKGARFNLVLIASFAIVAIVLASVGIYGAMACAVQERSREFGVRLALGQPPAAILRGTVWQSARFGVTASVLGIAITFVIARLIGNALYLVRGEHSGLLHGVTTTDPVALTAAAAALVVIATLSGIVPARQATQVDPLVALRAE